MTRPDAGGRILTKLSEQHDLLAKVGELCLAQARVIEEDEPEQLVAVLEQRSKVLARATELSKEIESDLTCIPENDAQMPLIRQRRRAVSDLAHAIAETDRQHGVILARKRDELARTLAGMNSGRAAAHAYGAEPAHISPGYQDRHA
ncbi:MAG: flagellar export chaperone FlgN [Planctomycetes bacterium]|nr:flagellar export chaperone FlgN [Planctomycetota bacterium]